MEKFPSLNIGVPKKEKSLASARICLTYEEGSSLTDDAALPLDEGKIEKKMKETMLVEEKSIVLEKVGLYVQSMTNGDLEVKRVEPKSNRSAPHVAAMVTAPAASKPTGVVEKKMTPPFNSPPSSKSIADASPEEESEGF
ncbi:hypothetical protein SDJN02_03230, partial [Cucurbita argyrosperma subsp. argyrosperma]